jgi:hypothetical protein
LASWAGWVFPWCFCTDTTRESSIPTHPNLYHTTLSPQDLSCPHNTELKLVVTFCQLLHPRFFVCFFNVIAFVDCHLWVTHVGGILAACFPIVSPSPHHVWRVNPCLLFRLTTELIYHCLETTTEK